MQVQDFIPNYPGLDDPKLQQKLMNKTEFAEIRPDNTTNVQPPYFDFQVNIARILSPYTPYNRALLFLDVGVGKCVHPNTAVKITDNLSVGIETLYHSYSATVIDENWSLPSKDVFLVSYGKDVFGENGFIKKKISKFYREPSPKFLTRVRYGNQVLIKTQGHKLYTKRGWICNVKSGDYVLDATNSWVEITVDEVHSNCKYVYDLEIEDTHTYIADGFVTHNTCATILVHEIAKLYYGGGFRKTVVMAKGPSLLDSYKTKFTDVCPGIRNEIDANYTGDKQKVLDESLKENFVFRTVGAFATVIKNMKDQEIIDDYSNRIIILDESHILKNPKSDTYKQYARFFRLLKNSVVIMMTGTPNTNDPWEAAAQINLLKTSEQSLVLGKKFMKKYYSGYEIVNEKELLDYYNGYVIHLKQSEDLPPREYMAKGKQTLEKYILYNVEMSEFQSKVYKQSLKDVQKTFVRDKNAKSGEFKIKELKFKIEVKDGVETKVPIEYTSNEGGAFLALSLESSLMVYPDGSYGGKGYKKNVLKDKKVVIPEDMAALFREDLGKYSALYAEMITIIKANPTRVIYIYFDNLNNSGLKLFAKLLEMEKYKYTKGGSGMSSAKRYGIIDGSMKEREINNILNSIGAADNYDASKIHILLGSEVTQTGLTIDNATICMVANAQFTPSSIDQITHRINRPGSLHHLEQNALPTDTSIYLFSVHAHGEPSSSVYTQVYEIAEEKSLKIEPQETLMKRAGLFCPLNYKRNVRSSDDNYICYTAKPTKKKGIYKYTRQEEDTKTDFLYFHTPEVQALTERIIDDVGNEKIVDIKRYKDEPMLLYRACKTLASQKIILDTNGYRAMIFNKGDLFFMDPTLSGDPNCVFYFQTNLFSMHRPLRNLMNERLFAKDEAVYTKLLKTKDADKALKLFQKLSKITQNIIFEDAYIKEDPIISTFKPVYTIDDKVYNIVWAEPLAKDSQYSSTTIAIEDPSRLRVLGEHGWAWVPSKTPTTTGYEDIIPQIKTVKPKKEIEGDFYASKSKTDNVFKVYVGKGKAGGRTCHELSTKILLETFQKLGMFKKYASEIKEFKAKYKNVETSLEKLLKVTKYKAIPEDFSKNDRIASYFVLQLTNKEKCDLLEKEFKKQKLFHVLD